MMMMMIINLGDDASDNFDDDDDGGWSCMRIPLPHVWEIDSTFFFMKKKKCRSPPHSATFSWMARHDDLHPIVTHLPCKYPAYATDCCDGGGGVRDKLYVGSANG